ncbi:MAG: rhomboid family intramembrane serine protease [Planctomycetales bacterium]|nr:rhomboid family intramembrane serine protease [Planctomycetales bacterium]
MAKVKPTVSSIAERLKNKDFPYAHTVWQELRQILIFLAVIWGLYIIDWATGRWISSHLGLVPRTLKGILGIAAMTFLHADWEHIVGNTGPLFVLLCLLAGSRAQSWRIVLYICGVGGALLWLFGSPFSIFSSQPTAHIGASLLVFGLITFLISSGYFERRPIPMIIAVVVGFLYGFTLILGIIPKIGSRESWDGHLSGAVAGVIVAFWLIKQPKSMQDVWDAIPKRKARSAGTASTVDSSEIV